MEKSKKVFLIFTAIFLGCVLILGSVFAVIGIVKNHNAVMKYKGITAKDGVVNYISASYKYDYMSTLRKSGINCTDTEAFWQSKTAEGRTYADILKENTEKYIKSVLVGSYLFDQNTRLTKNDKAAIKKSVTEVLEYRAGGDVAKFNEIGESMGFSYKDFEKAATLLYKSEMAETVIFGYEGSALSSGNFITECDSYFENNYARVKLMIIRTDGDLAIDPDTGKQVLREYSEEEKAAAIAKIDNIRELIATEQMNESAFDWHIANEYSTGTVNDTLGYYFSDKSSYSVQFAQQSNSDVVKLALTTPIGEYAEAELDIGVCFLLRCPLEEGAYGRISLSHFFEDFYKNAAPYIYTELIEVYLSDVTVKDGYDADAVISQPYNYELTIKFG